MPARPLPELPGVRHRDVQTGDVRLHVAEMGAPNASPVLLVHGWPQNWWCWRLVAERLSSRFRCLMPDLRGHGWSEAPISGYEKERLAGDLVNLADALRLDRFAYVGHDWGGFVGFLLALRIPDRVSHFLALSVPHLWPSRNDRLNPWRLASLGYQVPLSAPLVGRGVMRAGAAKRILTAGSPTGTFSEADLEIYDGVMRSPDGARTTVAMYRTFLMRELPALAAGRYAGERLSVPTRLVVGDRDLIVRGADLRGFESHADDMTVERVPRAGHFLPEERPELVSERAESFFA